MNFMEWFTMDGYAGYVWPSYVLGVVIFVANLWLPLRQHRRLLNDLRKQQ